MDNITHIDAQTETVSTKIIGAGFTDPVFDSQHVFKKVLEGMSSPGVIKNVDIECENPPVIHPVTAALCLSLCDSDTKVWLSASHPQITSWLKFHCGCQIVKDRDATRADFAIIIKGSHTPELDIFSVGTPEAPDKSVTIIFEAETFDKGTHYIARGPGIKTENRFAATGIDENLLDYMRLNKSNFPMGIDAIITAEKSLICLSRTTITRSL